MKGKKLLLVLMAMVMTLALCLVGCGSKKEDSGSKDQPVQQQTEEPVTAAPNANTLEIWWNENPDTELVRESAEEGVEIVIKDNTLRYVYELTGLMESEEELAILNELTEADFKELFDAEFEEAGPTFEAVADALVQTSGINGIKVVVQYNLSGKEVYSKEFSAK